MLPNGRCAANAARLLPRNQIFLIVPFVFSHDGHFGVWGGGGRHKPSVFGCLPPATPIGLSPLLILTLCGPERVLVVSTEPWMTCPV